MRKAIEHAEYLKGRGYDAYIYEFLEEKPERHRRVVWGPEHMVGTVAPPYQGGA